MLKADRHPRVPGERGGKRLDAGRLDSGVVATLERNRSWDNVTQFQTSAMSLSENRHYREVSKQRTRRKMATWSFSGDLLNDPAAIGKNDSVHCRGCSCYMCKHTKDVPPMRERPFLNVEEYMLHDTEIW